MVATSRAMLTTSGTLLNFKVKAVVYTCSPNYISVMSGLWRDVPHKISHKVTTTGAPPSGLPGGQGPFPLCFTACHTPCTQARTSCYISHSHCLQ